MKSLKFLMSVLTILFFSMNVVSQKTLYFMDRIPRNIRYNPALMPHENFFLGLPGIGNQSVEVMNSGFNAGELIDFLDKYGDSGYDPDEFIQSIGDYNKFYAETDMNLISFGFKIGGKGYLSFLMSQRNSVGINTPSNGLYLMEEYENIKNRLPLTVSGLDIQFNTFSQLAITYSRHIGNKLTLGISPKLVFAIGGIKTGDISIEATDSGDDDIEINLKGDMHLGLPIPINPAAIDSQGEWNSDEEILQDDWFDQYLEGGIFHNAGFAFDLGAAYVLNDKWSFSASLTDLGTTRWKKNGYLFKAVDSGTAITKDQQFKMTIPSKLYLAARYRLSDKWDSGLLFRNLTSGVGNYSSATLSLNGVVGKILTTSVSYTVPGRLGSLGLGFCLRFLPGMDLYVVTDDILYAFNYKKINHLSLSAGVNMAIGVRNTNR